MLSLLKSIPYVYTGIQVMLECVCLHWYVWVVFKCVCNHPGLQTVLSVLKCVYSHWFTGCVECVEVCIFTLVGRLC